MWHSESSHDPDSDLHPVEKPSGKLHPLKNQDKLELYKLISPAQCLRHVWKSHVQGNFLPQSESLQPYPYSKILPAFRCSDALFPVLKHSPLGTYLFDDFLRADGECCLSGLSLEHSFSKGTHQFAKLSVESLSEVEFLLDALKGNVILGEPRNLAGLAKTWKGGGLDSKEWLQEMDKNEGVLLTEVSLQNCKPRVRSAGASGQIVPLILRVHVNNCFKKNLERKKTVSFLESRGRRTLVQSCHDFTGCGHPC